MNQKLTCKTALCLVAGAVSLPFAAVAQNPESGNENTALGAAPQVVRTPKGIILKGQIEHTTTLPPAGADLYPGANFHEDKLPPAATRIDWFQIPEWFAGTFKVERYTIVKSYDFRTGQTQFINSSMRSEGEERRGYQRDADGNIWQLHNTADSSRTRQDNHVTYNQIQWYGPEEVGEGRVVMRILATSVLVDRQTNLVVQTYRREDIKTYVPLRKGVLSVSITTKGFNLDGSPQDLQTGFSVHQRVRPFAAVDRVGDTDVRKLFKDYLLSHHLADLVPRDLRAL